MTVEPSDPTAFVFPNNIVEVLIANFQTVAVPIISSGVLTNATVNAVVRRPVRIEDPNGTLGIFPVDWVPTDIEIGQMAPVNAKYLVSVQFYSKYADEEEGRRVNGAMSKGMRSLLYQSQTCRLALNGLSETGLDGSKERAQRFGIVRQRFTGNDIQGQFVRLSTVDFWLETETAGGAFH